MTTKSITSCAFSLLELLIVIAIISILTAMLFPVVQQAIIKGQAVAVGNDGKQLWYGLFAENIERERRGQGDVWPTSADYATSTEFFRDAIGEDWLGEDYTFSFMGAPGVPKALTVDPNEFNPENNAWCIALDVGPGTRQETPFMFTRNFSASGGTLADVDGFTADTQPFGDRAGVIVTYGGAVKILTKKDLGIDFQKLFNPYNATNMIARP